MPERSRSRTQPSARGLIGQADGIRECLEADGYVRHISELGPQGQCGTPPIDRLDVSLACPGDARSCGMRQRVSPAIIDLQGQRERLLCGRVGAVVSTQVMPDDGRSVQRERCAVAVADLPKCAEAGVELTESGTQITLFPASECTDRHSKGQELAFADLPQQIAGPIEQAYRIRQSSLAEGRPPQSRQREPHPAGIASLLAQQETVAMERGRQVVVTLVLCNPAEIVQRVRRPLTITELAMQPQRLL